jgi:hypothetical protein
MMRAKQTLKSTWRTQRMILSCAIGMVQQRKRERERERGREKEKEKERERERDRQKDRQSETHLEVNVVNTENAL